MKKGTLAIIATILCTSLYAQSFAGLELDNYAGVKGLIFNPSNVVDSRFKTDINLAAASVSVSNDYFGIDLGSLIENSGEFDFDEEATRDTSNANSFNVDTDILGPGFMFNLTPKSSIAITTRLRGNSNANNVNGLLFESIAEEFDVTQDFNFDINNLNATNHVWAEAGITYGRVLADTGKHFLKAGVTAKALFGAGVVYTNGNDFSGDYDADAFSLTTQGSVTYGTTFPDVDEEFNFDNTTTGFGVDVGLTYELRSQKEEYTNNKGRNKYRLKLGLAVTDIGSISYDDVEQTTYDLNESINTENYQSLIEFLDDNYQGTTTNTSVAVNLPTALRLYADLSITKNIFLGASAVFSLLDKEDGFSSRVTPGYRVIPRYESTIFGLQSPLGVDENGTFNWGAGVRLGPVVVGSNSIVSNLINDNTQAADLFVGVNIPIYQSKRKKHTDEEAPLEEEE